MSEENVYAKQTKEQLILEITKLQEQVQARDDHITRLGALVHRLNAGGSIARPPKSKKPSLSKRVRLRYKKLRGRLAETFKRTKR